MNAGAAPWGDPDRGGSGDPGDPGHLAEQLTFYAKPRLLIVDELWYLPLERTTAHLFFQLVAHRYERGSILLTTNQPVTDWGQVFGDETIAAAILDRLLHHSHTLVIKGEFPTEVQEAVSSCCGNDRAPS